MTNVFMIMCDELRADSLGFMGNKIIKTPNLDDFSKDAVVFENAYCNTPMCVPSRVSIATGRYAHSHGALDNMLSPLDDEISFYSILQKSGYRTFNYGKWHCNISPDKFGMDKSRGGGQDTQAPEKYITCFGITDRETRKKTDHKRNYGEIPLIISGTRPTHKDETMDSIVTKNYIKELDELELHKQPVFARLSIMDPHTPYIPSEPFASMYNDVDVKVPDSYNENLDDKPVLQRYFRKVRGFEYLDENDFRKSKASYYGLVSHVDERVGKVIDELKEKNLYDESLIIFIADHGSMMGEHGFIEKWGYMYEPVMRIPLMIKLPNNIYSGKRLDSFVESVDLTPTIFEILGIDIPKSVQGKSLVPYMKGICDCHKQEVYGQYYCGSLQNESALVVRDEKWKLTSYPEGNKLENMMLNDHHLRMSNMFNEDSVLGELYDMEKDPEELDNLFDDEKYSHVKEKYMNKIESWIKSLGDIVDSNTMQFNNNVNLHVIKQGENMINAQKSIKGELRWSKLKRKSNI
ncbi:hypothetical protein SH1V18_06820 [Vallitalea longa]|uniref:Sulfatase N-terminal domain-containing protein n=1 Tax=Vallitalea longa TaxID=2936439 RepID=A0A9W6DEA2_9FIRM|nr:sulfatase-like hydrolase/transferase [Vallitalea longa]GKX28202.1 hypothetical protein SH1V18_06820 [Vallitalea longa]